jgi:hypothetical protein
MNPGRREKGSRGRGTMKVFISKGKESGTCLLIPYDALAKKSWKLYSCW